MGRRWVMQSERIFMSNSLPDRKTILMVDDDPDTSLVMKRLLGGLGYKVETAHSVESALEAFGNQTFDVLISDIGLPDGSGYDLMRELIARGTTSKLKGIAVSGYAMEEDVKQSLAAGFSQHVSKPVNIQRLQAIIEDSGNT
jgi:CheY-like chemotaxis protein